VVTLNRRHRTALALVRRSLTVSRSGRASVRLRLSRRGMRLLHSRGHLAVRLAVTVKNAGGSARASGALILFAPHR
jgi:hypothetical protein